MTADPVLAVITRLKSLTDVIAIVGSRVYQLGSLPEIPTFPYIIVQDISDVGDERTNTSNAGHARVQCSCFAQTDKAVRDLSQVLKAKLPCNDVNLSCGSDYLKVTTLDDMGHVPDQDPTIPVYIRHRDFRILYTY